MTSIRLRSSSLLAVAYQPEQEWLRVEFVCGEVYGYSGVPEVVYHDLLLAESKGRYFNQWIRDRFPMKKSFREKTIWHWAVGMWESRASCEISKGRWKEGESRLWISTLSTGPSFP